MPHHLTITIIAIYLDTSKGHWNPEAKLYVHSRTSGSDFLTPNIPHIVTSRSTHREKISPCSTCFRRRVLAYPVYQEYDVEIYCPAGDVGISYQPCRSIK
jgi:hypothetical protein